MTFYAWRARLKPDSLEAYRRAHAEMPPGMANALRLSGYADYRIFAFDDGEVFGSFRCQDINDLRAKLAAAPVSTEWQERMRPLLIRDLDPSTSFPRLMTPVFDLDDV